MKRRASRGEKWSVYILECADGSFYTGVTTDIWRRLAEHNSGKGSRAVKARRPARLVYKEGAPSRSLAQMREAEIKRWSHQKKLVFVAEGLVAK